MKLIVVVRAMPILSLLVACWPAWAEQVRVATPAQGFLELPVVVAMRNGYFQTEGLEIQKIQIAPEVSVKALAAGEVDFNLAWEASFRAALHGAPIRAVAALAARPLYALMARPEVRSGGNLAGKIVGIDTASSTIDFLSQVAARYLGANRQLNTAEIGPSELRLSALREGEIHATVVDLTASAKAEDEGFRRLLNLGDIVEMPVSGIFVTRALLAKRPERVKRFVRATLRGLRFIVEERLDTIRIVQHYLKLTPFQASRSYDIAIGAFARDGLVSDRVLAFSGRRAGEEVPSAAARALNHVADWSLLRAILAERRKVPFWLKLKPYDF
jgi:NitT/TauT family transport system substrate-binding protein